MIVLLHLYTKVLRINYKYNMYLYAEASCLVRSCSDKWHEEMADIGHGSLSGLAQTLLTNKVYKN